MRKILNIKPEITPTHGDCLSSILYKIFEYKNICDFELLFKDEGHLSYTSCSNPTVPFDTNSLLRFNRRNYYELLEDDFSIRVFELKYVTLDIIKNIINGGDPVIIDGQAIDMPWRQRYGTELNSYHSCLAVGYDDDKQCLLCLDPIFEKDLLELPYSNVRVNDQKTDFIYLDFSYIKEYIHYNVSNLRDYFKSTEVDEFSWNSFIKLCNDILKKNSAGNLYDSNYYSYLLNNNSWFFLLARCNKIFHFFSYLYRNYDKEELNNATKLMNKCRDVMGTASSLVLKFSHTGDTQIAMRVVGKILEAADLERQANSNIQIALEKLE